MKPIQRIACVLVLVFIVTGCQTPIESPLVKVYQFDTAPDRPYEKIKLLYTVKWPDREVSAMNYFIRKAEILNADAILVLPRERYGFRIEPFQGHIGTKYKFKALAIKWKEQPAPRASAQSPLLQSK